MEPEDRTADERRRPRGGPLQWWTGFLTGLSLCATVTLVSPGGPGLVRILMPVAGEVVGLEGLELMARVPSDERVVPLSIRVYLNGADVTHQVTTGRNGAVGNVYGLLDGENVLRVEVDASSWWFDDRPYAAGREVRVFYRPRLDVDRG